MGNFFSKKYSRVHPLNLKKKIEKNSTETLIKHNKEVNVVPECTNSVVYYSKNELPSADEAGIRKNRPRRPRSRRIYKPQIGSEEL